MEMGIRFDALSKLEKATVADYVRNEYDRLTFQHPANYVARNAQADPQSWQNALRELIASDLARVEEMTHAAQGKMNKSKKGFTLIEIAIVLVIIGLIVGGVLVGQDLVRAAGERAQITQIEKYNQAVNTFRGQYGGLPGDLSIALANQFGFTTAPNACLDLGWGPTPTRDGNGIFTDPSGNGAGGGGEALFFWADLSQVHMISETFPNSGAPTLTCATPNLSLTPGASSVGTVLPEGKIGYGTYVQVYSNGGQNFYSLNIVYSMDIYGNTDGATECGGVCPDSDTGIPWQQASNIDAKIDDGLPQTGNVTSHFVTADGFVNSVPYSQASYSNCGNGSGKCALSFRFQ